MDEDKVPSPIEYDFEKRTENFDENLPKPLDPEPSAAAATNSTSDWNFFGGFQDPDFNRNADFANSSGAAGGANFAFGGFGMAAYEFDPPSYQLMPGPYDPGQSIRPGLGPYDPVRPILQTKFSGLSPVFAEFAEPAPNPPAVAFEKIIPSAVPQPAEPLYSPSVAPQPAESLYSPSAVPQPTVPQPAEPLYSPISPVDQSPPVVDSARVRAAVTALCQRFPAANAETLQAMLSEVTDAEFPKVLAAARDSLRAVDPNSKLARGKSKFVRLVEENFDGPDMAANENLAPISKSAENSAPNSAEIHIAEQIYEMFPQADPQFILAELGRGSSAENLIDRMMRGGYPKEKDRLAKERNRRRRDELMEPVLFEVDEFLLAFDDPEQFFANRQRVVSQLYIE